MEQGSRRRKSVALTILKSIFAAVSGLGLLSGVALFLLDGPPQNALGPHLAFLWKPVPLWTWGVPVLALLGFMCVIEWLPVGGELLDAEEERALEDAKKLLRLHKEMLDHYRESCDALKRSKAEMEASEQAEKAELKKRLDELVDDIAASSAERKVAGEITERLAARLLLYRNVVELARERTDTNTKAIYKMAVWRINRMHDAYVAFGGKETQAFLDAYMKGLIAFNHQTEEPKPYVQKLIYHGSSILGCLKWATATWKMEVETFHALSKLVFDKPHLSNDEVLEACNLFHKENLYPLSRGIFGKSTDPELNPFLYQPTKTKKSYGLDSNECEVCGKCGHTPGADLGSSPSDSRSTGDCQERPEGPDGESEIPLPATNQTG